jgi:hypothetical protein
MTKAKNQQPCSLKQMQTLMARLNFISSMCSFLNTFKLNLNNALSAATATGSVFLGKEADKDLSVWMNFLNHQEKWIPIPHEVTAPPWHPSTFGQMRLAFQTTQSGHPTQAVARSAPQ